MNKERVREVIEQFRFEGEYRDFETYGNGHINDTYRYTTTERQYLVQRINQNVFKKPEVLMENVRKVTEFIRQEVIHDGGDVYRETLNLIETKDGKSWYRDSDGEYWRVYVYIDNTFSFDLVEKPEDFYQSALAFGNFQRQLSGFPTESLDYTIEKFHHTPSRYQAFIDAMNEDVMNRVQFVQEEINFVKSREAFTRVLWDYHDQGHLDLKVTHNDTKLNNVLIDKETRKYLCVIDLDTVMPGFALDDFGDSIRFGASSALEDEKDLSKVNFMIDLYEVYVKGFLEGSRGTLTEFEASLFPEGAKMMTLECGIRFLTDYLQGDTYFKTAYDDHNLVRTRTQFKLVSDMENEWEAMKRIATETYKAVNQ